MNKKSTTVVITELGDDLHFFAQEVENGPQLEKLMDELRTEMAGNPPLPGSFTAKRGDLCAAKYTDDEWYRAKVEKINKDNTIHVHYVDYGNKELTTVSRLAVLPSMFHATSPMAKEYSLACISMPSDEDAKGDAEEKFYQDTLNKELNLTVQYRVGSLEYVTLQYKDSKEDVGRSLISDGLVIVEKQKAKWMSKLVADYTKAQEKAKDAHVNLWRLVSLYL